MQLLRSLPSLLVGAGWFLALSVSHALQIVQVSPQGEVAQVRQVVVKFDAAVVDFGDPNAPAPVDLACKPGAALHRGTGRWSSEREWIYTFADPVPTGTSCTVKVKSDFKFAQGATLTDGKKQFEFKTAGPLLKRITPPTGRTIEEDQVFVLEFNTEVTPESVRERASCVASDVGERIAVRVVDGKERETVLKIMLSAQEMRQRRGRLVALQCQRTLSAQARVHVELSPGVLSVEGARGGGSTHRWSYSVRESLKAEFSCGRENAQAACSPLMPMHLQFSAGIPLKMAKKIRLQAISGASAVAVAPSWDNELTEDSEVDAVTFQPPFVENTTYQLSVPADLRDSAGRGLHNAQRFPLQVSTVNMPPLVKFSASPFGIVERLSEPGQPALLPMTVRRFAGVQQAPVQISQLQPQTDAQIIAWFTKVKMYEDRHWVSRQRAQQDVRTVLPKAFEVKDSENSVAFDTTEDVETRSLSLLTGVEGVKTLNLPQNEASEKMLQKEKNSFTEVVGIPLNPGFHVLEVGSKTLGDSLLHAQYGAGRTMYVRTSALVTNLAVHFKRGREGALAWVTTLDKAKPIEGARVQVSGCDGQIMASGQTNAQGVVEFAGLAGAPECAPDLEDHDSSDVSSPYFVSARHAGTDGVPDMAFTWSHWDRGIEPWRFHLPLRWSYEKDSTRIVHTVLDRTLLRAGETVSMKHFWREQVTRGLRTPDAMEPGRLSIVHVGSGQRVDLEVSWRSTPTGGVSAENSWSVPANAKLGVYHIKVNDHVTGSFRVEEFRLPLMQGKITPSLPSDQPALIKAQRVPVNVQLNYISGGAAARWPVRVSAVVREKYLHFPDYEEYSFQSPSDQDASGVTVDADEGQNDSDEEQETGYGVSQVVANKLALTLDQQGQGQLTLDSLPPTQRAQDLLLEVDYSDPNGEVQTLRNSTTLWPSGVIAGIKTDGWVSVKGKVALNVVALNLNGKPQPHASIQVRAVAQITTSSRKRMVGGFYSYDNQTRAKDLGVLCSGQSDAYGMLSCQVELKEAGNIELIAQVKDAQGRTAQAMSSVWVTQRGGLWFGSEDYDRMDLLTERKSYKPGETAKIQVRMPFRFATAWLSVERESVLHTEVVQLQGEDPTLSLKIRPEWGSNVYVSVLAVRGRLREVPWYSFFTWGFKSPREWWNAYRYEGKDYVEPTAMVDLSKPAFRLGVSEIRVDAQAHRMDVKVQTDKAIYPVRGVAQVTISATLPNGKPAAQAEVAVAAVDQALLELMPNPSWDVLSAMLKRYYWGVKTATAHMQVVGKRHFGRKAVPAGGGGGDASVRELFDTLLLWNPRVVLDEKGQARIQVPLNDSLSSFKIVAVADAGEQFFGTGEASISTKQDLQVISGVPPLVREGDQFRAQFTLRNTTQQAMKVQVTARATLLDLKPQTVELAAGQSREVDWQVQAPEQLGQTRAQSLLWEITAVDTLKKGEEAARDGLKVSQKIIPAIPLSVQQATLVQVDAATGEAYTLNVSAPKEAVRASTGELRGGIKLALQPKLAQGLPGVRDWFANYPYGCLEQQTSKFLGLRDLEMWKALVAKMPGYLDEDGLAAYFPPAQGRARSGSDTLSAYILATSHEVSGLGAEYALPPEVRDRLVQGLVAFVEGRIERNHWSPRQDLDVRKLAALEALSRYGQAQPRMLTSVRIAPNEWPIHAVIDWFNILKRMPTVAQRDQHLQQAQQILRSRLSWQGSKAIFTQEQDDYWWWLMQNGDLNMARLILAVLDDPEWKEDMGRLVGGLIARQHNGAWHTTSANMWGGLALEKFSAKFEATPVTGRTQMSLLKHEATVDWAQVRPAQTTDAQGAPHQGTWFGAPASAEMLRNNTAFLPWAEQSAPLRVQHQGSGKPWMTVQSLAAIQRTQPMDSGYSVQKTVTAVEQAQKGRYSRGDVLRVRLQIKAHAPMTWVVVNDPIPAGATILGSGLGRDSALATLTQSNDSGRAWLAFQERSFEAFRSYYQYVPHGEWVVEYTMRLNNEGEFSLPATRVEALYAPEMFGEAPNERLKVHAAAVAASTP